MSADVAWVFFGDMLGGADLLFMRMSFASLLLILSQKFTDLWFYELSHGITIQL